MAFVQMALRDRQSSYSLIVGALLTDGVSSGKAWVLHCGGDGLLSCVLGVAFSSTCWLAGHSKLSRNSPEGLKKIN